MDDAISPGGKQHQFHDGHGEGARRRRKRSLAAVGSVSLLLAPLLAACGNITSVPGDAAIEVSSAGGVGGSVVDAADGPNAIRDGGVGAGGAAAGTGGHDGAGGATGIG